MGNDYAKHLAVLSAAAQAQGWAVTKTSGDHWRFVPADPDAPIVIAPSTSSADRAIQNLRGELRRSGLVI